MKYNVDGAFKRLILCLQLVFKTIITLRSLAFISLQSTFSKKSSCSNFSLLAEPMADLMNEALNTSYLSALLEDSLYSEFYENPSLLDKSIHFEEALKLLFPILTNKGS